ncbi:MAG: acyltransferase [Devosia sp.]
MTDAAPALASQRVAALDGLRGWAALSVVLYHATWESFGVIYPEYRSFVPSLFGDGGLAVAVFFVLSGYVLTIGRWRRADNPNLLLTLVRRYIRLELPILAVVLLYLAVVLLGWSQAQIAAPIIQRDDWLSTFDNFVPDLPGAILFATVRVFWIARSFNYGPFLWTMIVELIGSVVVLLLSHRARSLWVPLTFLVLFAGLLLWKFPLAAPFPIGATIALLQRHGVLFAQLSGVTESRIATTLLFVALMAAAWVQMTFVSLLPISLVGVVVFLCVLRSSPAQSFLSNRLSGWLGTLSFSLYLVHVLVLMTVTSWLIIVLQDAQALNPVSAVGVAATTVIASVAAGWVFLPVELATLALIRRIRGPRPRQTATA